MTEIKLASVLAGILGIILGALQIVAMGALLAIGFHIGKKVVERFETCS